MGHTAWAIMMFVALMIYLAMIPSDIRKEKYTSAGFNINCCTVYLLACAAIDVSCHK